MTLHQIIHHWIDANIAHCGVRRGEKIKLGRRSRLPGSKSELWSRLVAAGVWFNVLMTTTVCSNCPRLHRAERGHNVPTRVPQFGRRYCDECTVFGEGTIMNWRLNKLTPPLIGMHVQIFNSQPATCLWRQTSVPNVSEDQLSLL